MVIIDFVRESKTCSMLAALCNVKYCLTRAFLGDLCGSVFMVCVLIAISRIREVTQRFEYVLCTAEYQHVISHCYLAVNSPTVSGVTEAMVPIYAANSATS